MQPARGPTLFITVPQWGREYFEPPLGRSRAYALAHELGLAIRLGERKLVIARRAADELGLVAVERVREVASRQADQ